MTKHAQNRKRFGRRNFKQRYFRLTTHSLSYSKAKGKRPICDIPLTELVAVERFEERSFKMQNIFRVSYESDRLMTKASAVWMCVATPTNNAESPLACLAWSRALVNHRIIKRRRWDWKSFFRVVAIMAIDGRLLIYPDADRTTVRLRDESQSIDGWVQSFAKSDHCSRSDLVMMAPSAIVMQIVWWEPRWCLE